MLFQVSSSDATTYLPQSLRSSPAFAMGGMGLRNTILHVDGDDVEDMYGGYISAARVVYMFLVSLDLDLATLRNGMLRSVALAYVTVAASLLVTAFMSMGMYGSMMHSPVRTPELLAATVMLAITDTSSITVARVAGEHNLTVWESRRLIVAVAIITNLMSSTTLAREKRQDLYRTVPQIKKGFLELSVAEKGQDLYDGAEAGGGDCDVGGSG